MSHNSLNNYYKTIFNMAQHYNYSIQELENLIPFERDIYVNMLNEHIESLKEE